MRQVPAGTQAQQEIGTYKEDLQTLQKVPARYLQIYVADHGERKVVDESDIT